MRSAAAGSQRDFTALVDLYRQSLYATAIAVTRNEDDALDAIQETLLTMWEKLPTLRDPGAFKTWMTRILVNHCRAILRERGRTVLADPPDQAAEDPDRDQALDVRDALGRLSQEDRLVLQLFYYEGMPVKDIASALETSQEAVRMRLSRGRKRFRKAYGEEGSRVS